MSLIRLHLNRLGHMELSFVNSRILRRMLQVVVRNDGLGHRTAYLQHDGDVQSVIEELPPRERRDLQAGWDVTARMDPWYAAHFYGHGAHTAFESQL